MPNFPNALFLYRLNDIMMVWLDSLEGGVDLELHNAGKIGDEDKRIFGRVVQKNSFFVNTHNGHEVWLPHLSDQPDPDVNVASFFLQLNQ
jgi:hypothetical protein